MFNKHLSFLLNLVHILYSKEGWTLLICEVKGQIIGNCRVVKGRFTLQLYIYIQIIAFCNMTSSFLYRLRSIAAYRDHFVRRLPVCLSGSHTFLVSSFLCRLQSIAAHRDHFVRRLSVRTSLRLSGSHTFLVVTHSYVSQATHAFLRMLPLWHNVKLFGWSSCACWQLHIIHGKWKHTKTIIPVIVEDF